MAPASEIGPQHLGTLWVLDLGEPLLVGPMPRVAIIFQHVGPEAAQLLAQAMELDDPAKVLQRVAAGKRCFIGTVEGQIPTYAWATFGEQTIRKLRLRIR